MPSSISSKENDYFFSVSIIWFLKIFKAVLTGIWMCGYLTCNYSVGFLDKPSLCLLIFLAYDTFIPETYTIFLATVITTWASESNQVHALCPTLATTGVTT